MGHQGLMLIIRVFDFQIIPLMLGYAFAKTCTNFSSLRSLSVSLLCMSEFVKSVEIGCVFFADLNAHWVVFQYGTFALIMPAKYFCSNPIYYLLKDTIFYVFLCSVYQSHSKIKFCNVIFISVPFVFGDLYVSQYSLPTCSFLDFKHFSAVPIYPPCVKCPSVNGGSVCGVICRE